MNVAELVKSSDAYSQSLGSLDNYGYEKVQAYCGPYRTDLDYV